MKSYLLRAGCKVNLYLDILGVRKDGYHFIESLFFPLPRPYDELHIQTNLSQNLTLTTNVSGLDARDNILTKVYTCFVQRTGFAPGLNVHLEKNIPMGAGLGGGSSDAAVFLRWLNTQAGAQALSEPALQALAVSLGADLPFFLQYRPAWVTGIGEQVFPLDLDLSAFTVVLVCPDIHISTQWAYARWDEMHAQKELVMKKSLTEKVLAHKDLCFTNTSKFYNVFERVVFPEFPVLYELKGRLLDAGAQACVLSGSGSSLVAFFSSQTRAEQILDWGIPSHCLCLPGRF